MHSQKLDIKTSDGVCDAFVTYPGEEKYPAVLLYMDAYGLRPYLYEMAEKLASHGYFVLVPNLLYRQKRSPIVDLPFPLKLTDMPEAIKVIMPLIQNFKPEAALEDVKHYFDFLSAQKNARADKTGITGYCMGGSMAIRTAARFADRVSAVASYHAGNLASDAPNSPHLLLSKIKAEVYIGHADNDKSMPPEQIERLKKALDDSGLRYKAELYSGAAHGFTMADLPAFNKAALEKHWESLLDLFARNLR